MRAVSQLLDDKGREIVSIAPGDSVIEALRRMAQHGVGALLVMEGSRLVGVVSERDYARKVILQGRSSSNSTVADIMTSDVKTVGPDDRVKRCMEIMTEGRFRHLPVVDGDTVLGVLSIGDLLKVVIEDQREEISQLQQYIAG